MSILRTIEEIFYKKRNYIFRIPKGKPVVFLASGGLDSTVTMDIIMRKWNCKIHALFIRRKARAEVFEERSFDFFVEYFSKKYPKNFISFLKIDTEIPPKKIKPYFKSDTLQAFGYPMRDIALLNIAIQYAVSLNDRYRLKIRDVFCGFTKKDIFPHCKILSLRLSNLIACVDMNDWSWQISSPLLEGVNGKIFTKKDLIKFAHKNSLPIEKTRSCIREYSQACGKCLECQERINAFKSTGFKDSIRYRK